MKGSAEFQENRQSVFLSWLHSPSSLALFVGFGCAIALLLLPVWPAVGLFYWDIIFWIDAAHRIDYGQIPNIDFFAHFGPLPQYGLWLIQKIFPTANPVLAAQLSYSVVGLPLLALILTDVSSRLHSVILAGSFIVLLLLPANFFMAVFDFGIDGFGIFNRQAGLSLYLLVACIWWCRSPTRLLIVISCTLLCLLFTKITVFGVACAFVFYAFLMGRISARGLGAVLIAVSLVVCGLEIATGMVSAYLRDIATMASSAVSSTSSEQRQDPLHRVAFTVWSNFDTLIPVGLMIIAALVRDQHIFANARSMVRDDYSKAFRTVLQADGIAMGVLLLAAIAIESQNSGSQEFAFLVPAVFCVMVRPVSRSSAAQAFTFLAAAFLLIVGINAAHRAFLITYQAVKLPRLDVKELIPFHIAARASEISLAAAKLAFYSAQQNAYAEFASRREDLASVYDEGFQLPYFLSVGNAVRAIRRWQAENNVQLKSVAALDFVDPFPTLLNLKPVVGLGIVMDPYRTVGQRSKILSSLSTTDGILVPVCPVNDFRYQYARMAKLELDGRRAISIDPCWMLFVKNEN